jgi:hypothetical protein
MMFDTENIVALILIIMSVVLNIIYLTKLRGIHMISPIIVLALTGYYAYVKYMLNLDTFSDYHAMGSAGVVAFGTLFTTIVFISSK